MNASRCARVSALALAAFVASSLPAMARNSQTITLEDTVMLNGVKVAPGVYKIAWESHSPEAMVTLLKSKHVVTTTEARWVERGIKYTRTALVYAIGKDGLRSIVEIRFAGMRQALVFSPNPETASVSRAIPACATVSPAGHAVSGLRAGEECVQFADAPAAARTRIQPAVWPDPTLLWPIVDRRAAVMRKMLLR